MGLEEKLSYNFENKDLLEQALTHPSSKKTKSAKDYERLEFLGDSILGFVIAKILYNEFPNEAEGKLAKRKAAIVSKETLSEIAKEISLGQHLILGVGEDQIGGRENNSNLENALEAIIAAIFLDGGIKETIRVVKYLFSNVIKKMEKPPKDPKSRLQEWAQSQSLNLPEYKVTSMTGPAHQPEITVQLKVGDIEEEFTASSKKEAERYVAAMAISQIEADK